MKYHITIFIVLSVTVTQNVFSQSEHTNDLDSLRGKKGLVFSFSGLNLGGGLGGKYWLSSQNALRLHLSANYYKYLNESSSNNSSILMTLGIENHFQAANNLSPYIGGSFGVSRSGRSNVHEYRVELGALVGIELWIYQSVTLSGEQSVVFAYSANSESDIWRRYQIYTSTSLLLLSVYF